MRLSYGLTLLLSVTLALFVGLSISTVLHNTGLIFSAMISVIENINTRY